MFSSLNSVVFEAKIGQIKNLMLSKLISRPGLKDLLTLGSDAKNSQYLLNKLFRLRMDIDPRIEPVLIEESNDKGGFLEDILKNGEIVYTSEEAAA